MRKIDRIFLYSVPTRNRNLINSRFGFLSCITGLTSVCLFGLTIAINLSSLNNEPGQICPRQYRASTYRNDIMSPRKDDENRQCKGKSYSKPRNQCRDKKETF